MPVYECEFACIIMFGHELLFRFRYSIALLEWFSGMRVFWFFNLGTKMIV